MLRLFEVFYLKGQLSAEMLIILVIILGIVFIAFTQMTKSAKEMGGAVDAKTQQLIEKSGFNPADVKCATDDDCIRYSSDWSCDKINGYCQE